MRILICFICALACVYQLQAQSTETQSPILFIYDASGSMWGQLEGKTKKEIAASVLATSVNNLPESQNIGLVAYGHRTKGDCNDVEFMVDLNNSDKSKVVGAVKGINPLGRTPLARSATMAINSLRDSGTKATIILITDGIESCDGDICAVVRSAKADGIDFKLHIVGFGLKEGETEQLKCAAEAGGGKYYDANDSAGLGDVLTEATQETVDEPDDNFSIFATKNGEPVDAWVRAFPEGSNKEIDLSRSYRDSAFIHLPPGKYTIEVRPLEQSKIQPTSFTVEMKEGETGHKDVSFDGGTINLVAQNNGEGWDATVRIRTKDGKQVAAGRTYGKTQSKEVNAGIYDVWVLGLKMKGLEVEHVFEDVEVISGQSVDLLHNFKTGKAMIGIQENGELVDVTIAMIEATTDKNVAGGRSYKSASSNPREFILSPGNYKVKLRGRKNGVDTIKWLEVTVKEGETVTKIYEW